VDLGLFTTTEFIDRLKYKVDEVNSIGTFANAGRKLDPYVPRICAEISKLLG